MISPVIRTYTDFLIHGQKLLLNDSIDKDSKLEMLYSMASDLFEATRSCSHRKWHGGPHCSEESCSNYIDH